MKMDALIEREQALSEWLDEHGQGCCDEQRHLDPSTEARVYWHYGYLMALRDVMAFVSGRSIH